MDTEKIYIKGWEIERFREYLQEKENSSLTIEKYVRDDRTFLGFLGQDRRIDKERLLSYKEWLTGRYAVSSVNSMLAALNQFLSFMELGRLKLRRIRVQRTDMGQTEKALSRDEFRKLVCTARENNKAQIAMIMETMCATGIRVSELKFFRVENVRTGIVRVWNKGKHRMVLLPAVLKKKLLLYMKKNNIRSGMIFRTKGGKEKDRSNIWKEMKQVAKCAGIELKKVFPHNLRHLFARTFYRKTKNLINLADILGHSSIEVTRIYTTEGIEEWRRCLEKLDLLEDIKTTT